MKEKCCEEVKSAKQTIKQPTDMEGCRETKVQSSQSLVSERRRRIDGEGEEVEEGQQEEHKNTAGRRMRGRVRSVTPGLKKENLTYKKKSETE